MANLSSNSHGFLSALQLADSFFPTGMYAHSHGLEPLVSRGWVREASDVAELLRNQLAWAVIPADGVALLNAHSAASQDDLATLVAIDWLLFATKLPAEARAASRQAGRRILQETQSILASEDIGAAKCPGTDTSQRRASLSILGDYWDKVTAEETPGTGAVALGVVACPLNIQRESALLMLCHSHAVSVLGAAMRLRPFTHTQAQQVLRSLHGTIVSLGEEVQSRPWQEITCFAPELDMASMLHETDELRLFAS
jgi:urease accessory protein